MSAIANVIIADGTGTAITLNMPTMTDYTANMKLTFIAKFNNNTSATTININGLGAKNLYKPNTTKAPNLKVGKPYTVYYNGINFFLQASAEGNALAEHVLAGKTFSNDDDTGLVGTINLSKLIPSNIKKGININGVVGKLEPTPQKFGKFDNIRNSEGALSKKADITGSGEIYCIQKGGNSRGIALVVDGSNIIGSATEGSSTVNGQTIILKIKYNTSFQFYASTNYANCVYRPTNGSVISTSGTGGVDMVSYYGLTGSGEIINADCLQMRIDGVFPNGNGVDRAPYWGYMASGGIKFNTSLYIYERRNGYDNTRVIYKKY